MTRLARSITTSRTAMRWWRVALALLVVAVSSLALMPAPLDALSTGWDKLNHASAFAVLGVAAVFAFPRSHANLRWILCALLAFGALIEVVQSFTPTRTPEWGDLLADSIGTAAGMLVAALIERAAQSR